MGGIQIRWEIKYKVEQKLESELVSLGQKTTALPSNPLLLSHMNPPPSWLNRPVKIPVTAMSWKDAQELIYAFPTIFS